LVVSTWLWSGMPRLGVSHVGLVAVGHRAVYVCVLVVSTWLWSGMPRLGVSHVNFVVVEHRASVSKVLV
jgi:hypothetical protein